jgi:phosphotriesterase-related protein
MPHLITTLGPKRADELGMILPHEHVFVDLRTPDRPGYAQGDAADVIRLMGPEIARAQAAGVTALVECSAIGVGRRADILRAVSEATRFPIVVPTGIYREPWVPAWAHAASEDVLAIWMQRELEGATACPGVSGIERTGVQAGWIKLSAGDDGITPCEAKILRAAARAALATGAIMGSHTIRGSVVRDQLDVVERIGQTPRRFIWIHAQAEPDFALNLEHARRGAWIEYDGIGGSGGDEGDRFYIDRILRMLNAGFGGQVMLSMDRGWYDPALPGGGRPKPFTYLSELFLPKLAAAGVDGATIRKLTCENPFRAFAR